MRVRTSLEPENIVLVDATADLKAHPVKQESAGWAESHDVTQTVQKCFESSLDPVYMQFAHLYIFEATCDNCTAKNSACLCVARRRWPRVVYLCLVTPD